MPGIDYFSLSNSGLDGPLNIVSSVGNVLYASSPSSVSASVTADLRRYKAIRINHIGGVFRCIVITEQGNSSLSAGKVCFYVNGIASSSVFDVAYAAGGMTYSHDVSINPGDVIEVYALANSGFSLFIRNFNIYSDLAIPVIAVQ